MTMSHAFLSAYCSLPLCVVAGLLRALQDSNLRPNQINMLSRRLQLLAQQHGLECRFIWCAAPRKVSQGHTQEPQERKQKSAESMRVLRACQGGRCCRSQVCRARVRADRAADHPDRARARMEMVESMEKGMFKKRLGEQADLLL